MENSVTLYKKLIRSFSFPNPNPFFSSFSPSQSPLFSFSSKTLLSTINPTPFPSFIHSFHSLPSISSPSPHSPSVNLIHSLCTCSRSFSTSSSHSSQNPRLPKPRLNPQQVRQIFDLIRQEEYDMETNLSQMNVSLSIELIQEIFRHLNAWEVSGVRFFLWVREQEVGFNRSSEFCSLVIDNIGRIRDYPTMKILFKEFSKEKLCLTEKAFGFLTIAREEVRIVVKMLNEVGGSCYNSGIHGLIKMLCSLSRFDLAKFVMEETERKTSYYNVLIWGKCGRIGFEEARGLLDEMRRFGCEPDENSYGYLLGTFCKNGKVADGCRLLEVMKEFGIPLNETTFEMVICRACRLGRLDFAVEFLNQMGSRGIEPRYTTHAVVIKGYFYSNRFHEAYKYVIDMGEKYKSSANLNYSLLATLLHRSRRLIEAREILVDMIEKGIKPHFPVYIKVLKDLHKLGKGELVADLKNRFSRFQ